MSIDSGPNAILDPTGRSRRPSSTVELAERRLTLRGVRVGLLENTKHNADLFLDELGRLLLDEHEAAELTRRTKTAFALPVSEDELADLAAHCDVVITGVGDCGSCSASAVADGVAFERHGIPAAVICSDAYRVTADAMADHAGVPGYRYVTTPHPVAVLAPEEVRERARQCLKDVVTLITSGRP
jgi:hypothetical protein